MKSKKLIFLEKILRLMAIAVLKKYHPRIVAVTGSVGKTTTKEAVWWVLSKNFSSRKNIKNYNNEVGVPLTIIGAQSGCSSIFGWLKVFFTWLWILIFPVKYPKILVLEIGADQPGDIKYLMEFVPIDVAVLTNIGISHLEKFKNKRELVREKSQILKNLSANGLAVLNFDNEECRELAQKSGNATTFGFEEGAGMRATDLFWGYKKFEGGEGEVKVLGGINFKLNFNGKIIPVRLENCISKTHVYSALVALLVANYFEINLLEACQKIANFVPYPGRMNLIAGIKHTAVIDDTYNSALDSALAAIETLEKIEAQRKIVVMGDMLELGQESEAAHQKVGQAAGQIGVARFIAVGTRMKAAVTEFVKKTGRSQDVLEFSSPVDAGIAVQNLIQPGDLILVKGSQGLRMEKVVEEIMAEPQKMSQLLVRQDRKWKEKSFVLP